MSAHHPLYHYSVTIMAVDKPVLGALRGLSFEVETASYPQIASGGTTGDVWEKNDNQVKFRFTSAELRARFLVEAARIFRTGLSNSSAQTMQIQRLRATPRTNGPCPATC